MKLSEIEGWALRVIDQIRAKGAIEDSRVEAKREWPDPAQAARQVAGHANAAAGEAVLWLIGVDESRGAMDFEQVEFADWHSRFAAAFEGLPPSVQDVNLLSNGRQIVALVFETTRAPFVTKNPKYGQPNAGPVQFEVPWREARSTRTARREDLVRILGQSSRLPSIETLAGELSVYGEPHGAPALRYIWNLSLRLYLVPQAADRLVIPNHKCAAMIDVHGIGRIDFQDCKVGAPRRMTGSFRDLGNIESIEDSVHVTSSSTEAVLVGAGALEFEGRQVEAVREFVPPETVIVVGVFFPVSIASGARFEIPLTREVCTETPYLAQWRYSAPRIVV